MKEKDAISESLRAYVAKYPSQTKAAGSLKGVSVGTVSNILNGRYENISDEMFRNVASQVGGVSATGWQIVETGAYQEITAVQQTGGEMRRRVFEYRLYCQTHQQWSAIPEAWLQGVLQPYRTEIL